MWVPLSHPPHTHPYSMPDPADSYHGILPPQMTAGSAFPRTRGLDLVRAAHWSSAPGQGWEQKMRSALWPCRLLALGVRENRKLTRQVPSSFQRHTPWKGGGLSIHAHSWRRSSLRKTLPPQCPSVPPLTRSVQLSYYPRCFPFSRSAVPTPRE